MLSKQTLFTLGAAFLILVAILLTRGDKVVIEDGANVTNVEVQDSTLSDTSEAVIDTIR